MNYGKEKRQSPRVELQSSLRYRTIPVGTAAGFRSADVEDVSQTGFRFHCQEFIPKRASIILEMNVSGYPPLHSIASAVWIRERPNEGGYEVGGRFVEPPHGTRKTLKQLVSG